MHADLHLPRWLWRCVRPTATVRSSKAIYVFLEWQNLPRFRAQRALPLLVDQVQPARHFVSCSVSNSNRCCSVSKRNTSAHAAIRAMAVRSIGPSQSSTSTSRVNIGRRCGQRIAIENNCVNNLLLLLTFINKRFFVTRLPFSIFMITSVTNSTKRVSLIFT